MKRASRGLLWLSGPAGLIGFTLSKGGGVPANAFRDDLTDNSIFVDDLGDGSILIDDLAA